LGKSLKIEPKVPGPWKDPDDKIPPLANYLNNLHDEAILRLKEKYQRISQHALEKPAYSRDAQEYLAIDLMKKNAHNLRDFPEGRYEDVVFEFQKKRAVAEGVIISSNIEEKFKELEKDKDEQRKKKKRNPQETIKISQKTRETNCKLNLSSQMSLPTITPI